MAINKQIKILDNKIRSNQAQYDLDKQNAKISPLSSGELDKYEYLTGEDLGYKADVVQKAKFEYPPLGQVFNNGLKSLKNTEDKPDNQLKAIKDQENKQLDLIKDQKNKQPDPAGKIKFTDEKINNLVKEIIEMTKEHGNKDLEHAVSESSKYNLNNYENLKKQKENKTLCGIWSIE